MAWFAANVAAVPNDGTHSSGGSCVVPAATKRSVTGLQDEIKERNLNKRACASATLTPFPTGSPVFSDVDGMTEAEITDAKG